MKRYQRAFTLIEMVVVIAIITILVGLVLPALSGARDRGRTLVCLSRLRELGAGWQIYADQNENVILPGHMYEKPGGFTNPENWYNVGNGLKYRPRWVATMGAQVGIYAFNQPKTDDDRQDYDNDIYVCPSEPTWRNERNHGFGYNHQFLGNARQTDGKFHNFPVQMHRITKPGGTVVGGDALGTAAGFRTYDRGGYDRLGSEYNSKGNHAYTLDPPRLTDESDRGSGDEDSPRTAVDPRHQEKANVIFADNHGAKMSEYELGYRLTKGGEYVEQGPGGEDDVGGGGGDTGRVVPGSSGAGRVTGRSLSASYETARSDASLQAEVDEEDVAHNRLFSGTGRDDDPPAIPQAAGG